MSGVGMAALAAADPARHAAAMHYQRACASAPSRHPPPPPLLDPPQCDVTMRRRRRQAIAPTFVKGWYVALGHRGVGLQPIR